MESPVKRVLILTNSEHGQANVCLATSYALLTLNPNVEVHFASFAPLQRAVAEMSQFAHEDASMTRTIVFHELDGMTMKDAWSRYAARAEEGGAWERMENMLKITLPWSGPEFEVIFRSAVDICRTVNPHVIAVDPLFSPGLTACEYLGVTYLVLSPNTIKDFALPFQGADALWRYPYVGSQLPFPIPLKWIPFNMLLILIALVCSLLDPHRRSVTRYLKGQPMAASPMTFNDVIMGRSSAKWVLVANRMALDFPIRTLPRHIIPCGTIIRPARSVAAVDPELAAWLRRAPTVYVNLGTHVCFGEDAAVQMAVALRTILKHADFRSHSIGKSPLQVLWKLHTGGKYAVGEKDSLIHDILGRDMESDAVRIVEWLDPDPMAILGEETVICAVNHGGANSFFEAVTAGVPQIVLPVWMDTFDFALRAELLGIGRWGNKDTKTAGGGAELGAVLIDILYGHRSEDLRCNSKRLAKLCNENGGGRVVAAKYILREMREPLCGIDINAKSLSSHTE